MSKSPGIQTEIKCPFFRALRDRSVVCESPVDAAISSSIFFKTQSRKQAHVIWHCQEMDGAGCPLYEAISKKYEEKGTRQDG